VVTAPGERFNYSNLGYGILGAVIERCSGMGYAEFVRRENFLPLGMYRSSAGIRPRLESYRAVANGHDGIPYPFYESDTPAASDIYSSAHDLLRFGMMHLKAHWTSGCAGMCSMVLSWRTPISGIRMTVRRPGNVAATR
jgi:CubicO group peptidase (beta-lactamase class C family)